MANHSPTLDKVFHALAHPVRREVVSRLGRGPAAVGDLARSHSLALPTFLQHVQVLESAQIVVTEKQGRTRVCRLDPRSLLEAETWLDKARSQWNARLDQLDDLLEELNRETEP